MRDIFWSILSRGMQNTAVINILSEHLKVNEDFF